jgi:hypothetical protein
MIAEEPPGLPSKSRNSSSLTEGRKEVICNTTSIQQGAIYPAYPSLRSTAGAPGEKNSNPKYRGTRD